MSSDSGDLFGDDSVAGTPPPADYNDREQLDSGDDDRQFSQQEAVEDVRVMDSEIVPHPIPTASNGELNVLRVPDFIKIQPLAHDEAAYTVPEGSSHSTEVNTIRYRKNKHGDLESNATFNKWSDGSITISIGENNYEIRSKPLAPKNFKTYNDVLDSHTYLATPHIDSQVMQIIGHITDELTVAPNAAQQDDAIKKLKAAYSVSGRHNDHKDVKNTIVGKMEDPETYRKKLEAKEREKMKLERRKEQANARTQERSRGVSGIGMGGASRPKSVKVPRKGGPRASRADYDDSEDEPRYGGRQDEYDEADPFLAASDEEEEVADDDDDEDEFDKPSPKQKKRKQADSEVDATGDEEDDAPAPRRVEAGRRKRQVIEDDEDDE